MAGLGGLLYGVDVGIIAGALPYLEATSGLNRAELSIVVAAVLLLEFAAAFASADTFSASAAAAAAAHAGQQHCPPVSKT